MFSRDEKHAVRSVLCDVRAQLLKTLMHTICEAS